MNVMPLVSVAWLYLLLVASVQAQDAGFPDLLQRVKPSVVAVGTVMPTRNPRGVFLGTGFVVDDGKTIITNAHVVDKPLDGVRLEKFAVFYRQDQRENMALAELVVVDPEHDLALLTLKDVRLPALAIADSDTVREGEVFAFTGYPIGMVLGLFPVTHRGMIAAISPNAIPVLASRQLNLKMLRHLNAPFDVFQLDATAYPGNSGSPVYDMSDGKVVAIVNKVFVQGTKENAITHPSGISYAIPSKHIKALLSSR
ncbi:MAG: trypsin-like peptidase domain-containing protein [Methylomonas sp.]|nr:trypsin-like peptidase domain-containing protein [Methylomonas sp.]PPD19790.1 MAG: serine protease [Methylomonas sp.]PPD25781.1 MAG: serine protease [Methylomonas sp.]PPD36971.1 MAG: serine protease [Methylomonas sp.]PPD37245.1 MAG: serine protease [Methylomonas sp.]